MRASLAGLLLVLALVACGRASVPADAPPFRLAEGDIFELAGVGTYRERATFTLSGPGPETAGSGGALEFLAEFVRRPPAQRVVISGPHLRLEMVRVEATQWVRYGESEWQQSPASADPFDPAQATLFAPADLVGVAEHLEFVGEEAVQGRPAWHFRGEGRAIAELAAGEELGEGSPEDLQGRVKVWVDPAGFVLRMEVVLTTPGLGAEGSEEIGTATSVYEIFDLGADLVIQPPG